MAVHNKPDSQEICFVQGGSYTDFLAQTAPETVQSGDIRDTSGKKRGTHDGIAFYTIGQRRRVNVGSPIPLYVVDINAETNTVVVGSNDDLMAKGLAAADINWVGIAGVQESRAVLAKIRYNMAPVPATVQTGEGEDEIVVHFDTLQRAVTPGQSLVLYDLSGDSVLGGATIQRRL